MRKPSETPFKQQNLRAWQPILTPRPVIITFLILGIIFIPIGAALLYASNSVVQVETRYDNNPQCQPPSFCTVQLQVPSYMNKPVYMYYGLNNFYQNHRSYVKSRNDDQLRGAVVTSASSISDCSPLASVGGSNNPAEFYLPCGLIAWSMFNDTFVLVSPNSTIIPLRKQGIAWESDVEQKFKNPPVGTPGIRVIADFQDEDFIVWMRTAGLPNFKKLYRIIDQDLPPGNYSVIIESRYDVSMFSGQKWVMLSTTSWIGGKNPFLGWAYISVGIVCFLLGIIFGLKHKLSPRKLGDPSNLDWTK
jgi:hypothetical protein